MRRLRAGIARALPLALLASVLVLFGSAPAQAAESIPNLQWSSVSLSDVHNAQQLISNTQGGVTVGCSNLGSTAFRQFDDFGDSVYVGNSAQPTPDVCPYQSAVGADGTLYAVVYTGSTAVLAAYDGTTLKWTYSPPCGGGWAIRSLVVGANGNIYMVLANGGGCSWSKLVGIESVVQPGQTQPQVVANTYIYGPIGVGGSLAAYDDGLVVRMTSGVAYFSYTGVESSSQPGSLNLAPHYGREFNATTAGRVFVPMKASSSTISSCGGDQSVIGSVDAYDAGETTTTWSYALSGCSWIHQLNPTPTGGVVAHVGFQDSNGYAEKLVALSPVDGHVLWSELLTSVDVYGNSMNGVAYAVDLNGSIILEREVRIDQDSLVLPAVWVKVFNANGTMRSTFTIAGDRSAGYGYRSTTLGASVLSIANDTVFVSARKCVSVTNCNGSDAKLFAVKVNGVEMDYPRGSLLGVTPQPSNELAYVGMGDSFSAALGVPAYSDTSGCNRSTRAYPVLLDARPDLNVSLKSFVACSGATTWNVQNGQNGEPAQLAALGSGTQLVTISIGGNDAEFAKFVTQCLFLDCSDVAVKEAFFDKVDDIGQDLEDTYEAILAAAPNAQIYVIGYPNILAESSYCSNPLDAGVAALDTLVRAAHIESPPGPVSNGVSQIGTQAGLDSTQIQALIDAGEVTFTGDEIDTGRLLTSSLNTKISQSVAAVGGSRLHFVSATNVGSPFAGHQLCNPTPFFWGVDLEHPENSFHPKREGQDAYAQLMASVLS